MFGTLADFDALLAEAHGLGLKVIIDQVLSRTAPTGTPGSRRARSPRKPQGRLVRLGRRQARRLAAEQLAGIFGGPAWTCNAKRRQYYLHNFLPQQPDLNFWNPDVQAAMLDVAAFWLDRGVDGFRLDVVNYYFHDSELPDNPPADVTARRGWQPTCSCHARPLATGEPQVHQTASRALMDSYDGERIVMTVGEIGDEPPLPRPAGIHPAAGPPAHRLYSFFLLSAAGDPRILFRTALESWESDAGWPSWSLGNHDVTRFPTRMAHNDAHRAKALFAALIAMRGTIFVYQGDELGLPDAHVPFERLQDPFAIAAYAGGPGRDGCRTPMPWTSAAPMGGFTVAANSWLPMDPAHLPLSIERQELNANSALHYAREVIAARRRSPALRTGACVQLPTAENVLGFERVAGGERVRCYFELGGLATTIQGAELAAGEALFLGGGATFSGLDLELPAYGAAIIRP